MPNLLMFKQLKDRDGYQIRELDPRGVDWSQDAKRRNSSPKGASPSIVRLQKRWSTIVGPEPGSETVPYEVLEPIGDETVPIEPLEDNPGLFVDFAETASNPEGVKSFADKYGQIQGLYGPCRFEPWYREIKDMKSAVRRWEEGKQEGSLRQFVNSFNSLNPEMFVNLKVFGDIGPASVTVGLQNSTDPMRPDLFMVPKDLLSAMWLQFAQQVSSSTGLRRCKWCSTWFVFGTGTGRRKSGHYCSPRCYKAVWKHENKDKL